jgi:hypothetical protein
MHSNPVEATVVAVFLLALYFALHGGFPAPSKFSVRALLIGTALVAAALGIIAYAARN